MCLFPSKNLQFDGIAYKRGIKEFDCGACPECLRKRSSSWALRAVYESKAHVHNCMITLTYDQFKYDSSGNIIGEQDVNPDLKVNKSHVQKFIKRLRKHFEYTNEKIKYIACAEYGSRTHRAHYHCILFGVKFNDASFYKKSKRGNPIYMSKTLTKLWSHGICTIDCINIGSAVARYCTKYCAKQRSDETFMLFSHSIGLDELMKDFNGRSYFIDGREYPIPRVVWQKYITDKYAGFPIYFSPKYVNRDYSISHPDFDYEYIHSKYMRRCYFFLRDTDFVYISYIDYWKNKSKLFERLQDTVINRIYALDDRKYYNYKTAALQCYFERLEVPVLAPGSKCVSEYKHWLLSRPWSLAVLSRPITASDTILSTKLAVKTDIHTLKCYIKSLKPQKIPILYEQDSFFY